jgi:hypothetical protein
MTFKELPTGSYFYFASATLDQIRRKVSARKYVWIKDYSSSFCNSEKEEEKAARWSPKRPALSKVIKIDFAYETSDINKESI